MMLDTDINSLENRKTELEIELNNLLKSDNKEEDKINEEEVNSDNDTEANV